MCLVVVRLMLTPLLFSCVPLGVLAGFVVAGVALLGMISCDPRGTGVGTVVDLSGVEAMVNAMRAFADSPKALTAITAALLNVTQQQDGAVAVVSRGGSRQISRMLQDAATNSGAVLNWGSDVAAVLEQLLAVIDVASDFGESSETLKKQGIVQIVVSVLDSSGIGDSGQAASMEEQSSGDRFDEVRRLITSILSKLLNMAEVGEATKAVQDTCTRIQAGFADGAGGGLSKAALSVGVAGLNKLAALCEVAVGRNGGNQLWRSALRCVPRPFVLRPHAVTCSRSCFSPVVCPPGGIGVAAVELRRARTGPGAVLCQREPCSHRNSQHRHQQEVLRGRNARRHPALE